MGCFDTITFRCVHCGKKFQEQDKGGACALKCYVEDSVPIANAVSLSERYCSELDPLICPHCHGKMTLVMHAPSFVALKPLIITEDEFLDD